MHWEFKELDHRPFPLPTEPWLMSQIWNDLLFVHWSVPKDVLQPLLPSGLELDCFEGSAWISFVSYNVTDLKLRYFPTVPYFSTFPGLNIRTYVTRNEIPGIYFFSLHTPLLSVIFSAKLAAGLPYIHARMKYLKRGNIVDFFSQASNSNWHVSYTPHNFMYETATHSIDEWLLERYRMYSIRNERIHFVDIHHDRWKISEADAAIHENTITLITNDNLLLNDPIVHYSRRRRCFLYRAKKD